ncbi:tetraacyldisaccharide 4'-kinase [Coxiella burnetii]|uniref:tetraacyldisaccharide 4'-kinase n=1 Tax=Coxiella burnetii TaxID=777 RepID=UPI000300E2F6|nr:tetraacyldisaccharide 4'-kinase [Coxiella burnetii]AML49162.1 tetraacyldisaccharide 4'-kinase [Coxiella burnetii]AML55097.1 tetraacyldisaccharide 4'-kinase [Coxiella burnetii]ATN69076.1 tetraacyldisaccharide 4'-kinase [Coxiella burnetii]ATN70993.1 tetraacyldisaccharide 4'-kinase [Coxiella burnetii]ATN72907.1 tetraacyldisaccharide 4'-kinase [Coxiella burnetii]
MLKAPRFWYQPRSLLGGILSPFSFLYQIIVRIRRGLYAVGLKKISKFPVPIVIVGNITVGGSGKTPFVIWLANELKNRGFRPGVVSRGYGGKANRFPQTVTENSDPLQVGDEAVLLMKKIDCPMVVCRDRGAAVKHLLRNFQCDVVIGDDGLQHYSLGRDLEIALIDDRHLGNGRCLPAGPLREPKSRLNMVDFVVPKQLRPNEIYQLKNPAKKIDFNELKELTVHAVAGIGNPGYFFKQLETLGANVIAHPFRDHYFYRSEDFNFDDDHLIILTEKDAIKCKQFDDERLFCFSVDAVVPDQFQNDFFRLISNIILRKQAQREGI